MTSQQLETLQMMANTLTGWAYMYGGPYSYHCYCNLLDQGYVERMPSRIDWAQITEKGKKAIEVIECSSG